MTDTIFAAHPGYMRLRFRFVDRKPSIDYTRTELLASAVPILAWRLVDNLALPIVIGEQEADNCVDFILVPGNMIFSATGQSWRGIDAVSVDVLKSHVAWREALPKTPAPPRAPLSGSVVVGARPVGFLTSDAENLVA